MRETPKRIQSAGGETTAVTCDVSIEADCKAMVAAALRAYGKLDVAFNNAGVGASGFAVGDEEEVAWDRINRRQSEGGATSA